METPALLFGPSIVGRDVLRGIALGVEQAGEIGVIEALRDGGGLGGYAVHLRVVEVGGREEVEAAEAVALQTAGHTLNILRGHEHGYVAYSQVYFTSEQLLARDPALIARFLHASHRGWAETARDPEAAVRLVTGKYHPGIDVEYQLRSLAEILKLAQLEAGPGSYGTMNRRTWKKMAKVFNQSGILQRPVTAAEMTDFRFQPQPGRAPR